MNAQRSMSNAQGGVDDVLAAGQSACLREAHDGVENFRDAVAFLGSGFFRGYGHLEKHCGQDGAVFRLEPVEQRVRVRDGMFGERLKNLCQKDWDSFLEVHGIPSAFPVGPPNTPESKEEEYQAIAEAIISDGRG